jgi:hypothetical protein
LPKRSSTELWTEVIGRKWVTSILKTEICGSEGKSGA